VVIFIIFKKKSMRFSPKFQKRVDVIVSEFRKNIEMYKLVQNFQTFMTID